MKQLFFVAAAVLFVAACQGPAADDAAICTDVVRRVCSEPLCETMQQRLDVGRACVETLSLRAGCDTENFSFGEENRPDRARVLECRLPLIRSGDAVGNAPACGDIDEMLDRCPDIERYLGDGGTL